MSDRQNWNIDREKFPKPPPSSTKKNEPVYLQWNDQDELNMKTEKRKWKKAKKQCNEQIQERDKRIDQQQQMQEMAASQIINEEQNHHEVNIIEISQEGVISQKKITISSILKRQKQIIFQKKQAQDIELGTPIQIQEKEVKDQSPGRMINTQQQLKKENYNFGREQKMQLNVTNEQQQKRQRVYGQGNSQKREKKQKQQRQIKPSTQPATVSHYFDVQQRPITTPQQRQSNNLGRNSQQNQPWFSFNNNQRSKEPQKKEKIIKIIGYSQEQLQSRKRQEEFWKRQNQEQLRRKQQMKENQKQQKKQQIHDRSWHANKLKQQRNPYNMFKQQKKYPHPYIVDPYKCLMDVTQPSKIEIPKQNRDQKSKKVNLSRYQLYEPQKQQWEYSDSSKMTQQQRVYELHQLNRTAERIKQCYRSGSINRSLFEQMMTEVDRKRFLLETASIIQSSKSSSHGSSENDGQQKQEYRGQQRLITDYMSKTKPNQQPQKDQSDKPKQLLNQFNEAIKNQKTNQNNESYKIVVKQSPSKQRCQSDNFYKNNDIYGIESRLQQQNIQNRSDRMQLEQQVNFNRIRQQRQYKNQNQNLQFICQNPSQQNNFNGLREYQHEGKQQQKQQQQVNRMDMSQNIDNNDLQNTNSCYQPREPVDLKDINYISKNRLKQFFMPFKQEQQEQKVEKEHREINGQNLDTFLQETEQLKIIIKELQQQQESNRSIYLKNVFQKRSSGSRSNSNSMSRTMSRAVRNGGGDSKSNNINSNEVKVNAVNGNGNYRNLDSKDHVLQRGVQRQKNQQHQQNQQIQQPYPHKQQGYEYVEIEVIPQSEQQYAPSSKRVTTQFSRQSQFQQHQDRVEQLHNKSNQYNNGVYNGYSENDDSNRSVQGSSQSSRRLYINQKMEVERTQQNSQPVRWNQAQIFQQINNKKNNKKNSNRNSQQHSNSDSNSLSLGQRYFLEVSNRYRQTIESQQRKRQSQRSRQQGESQRSQQENSLLANQSTNDFTYDDTMRTNVARRGRDTQRVHDNNGVIVNSTVNVQHHQRLDVQFYDNSNLSNNNNKNNNTRNVVIQNITTTHSESKRSKQQLSNNNKNKNLTEYKRAEREEKQVHEVRFFISIDGHDIYTEECFKDPYSQLNRVYKVDAKDHNELNSTQGQQQKQGEQNERMSEKHQSSSQQGSLYQRSFPSPSKYVFVEIDNNHSESQELQHRKKLQTQISNPLSQVKYIHYRSQKDLDLISDYINLQDVLSKQEPEQIIDALMKENDIVNQINNRQDNFDYDSQLAKIVWRQEEPIRKGRMYDLMPHSIEEQQRDLRNLESFVHGPHPVFLENLEFAAQQRREQLQQQRKLIQQKQKQQEQQKQQKLKQQQGTKSKKGKKEVKKKNPDETVNLQNYLKQQSAKKQKEIIVAKQPTGSLYQFELIKKSDKQKLVQVRRSGRIFSKSKAKFNESVDEDENEDNQSNLNKSNINIKNKDPSGSKKRQTSQLKTNKKSVTKTEQTQKRNEQITLDWLKSHISQLNEIVVENVYMEDQYKAMTEKDAEISKFLYSLENRGVDVKVKVEDIQKEENKQEIKKEYVRENEIMRPSKTKETSSKGGSKQSKQSKPSKKSKSVKKRTPYMTKKQLAKRSNIKIQRTIQMSVKKQNPQKQGLHPVSQFNEIDNNNHSQLHEIKLEQETQVENNFNAQNDNSNNNRQWTHDEKVKLFNQNKKRYRVPNEFPLTVKEVIDPDILNLGVYALVRLGRLSQFELGTPYAITPLCEIRYARIKDVKDAVQQSKKLVPKQYEENIALVALNSMLIKLIQKAKVKKQSKSQRKEGNNQNKQQQQKQKQTKQK